MMPKSDKRKMFSTRKTYRPNGIIPLAGGIEMYLYKDGVVFFMPFGKPDKPKKRRLT